MRLRWRIVDLFVLVALVGVALGAYRSFYLGRSWIPWDFVLAVYLAALALATIASFSARPRWTHLWQSYALFAWIYLVLVLHGGFKVQYVADAETFQIRASMGMVFGLLCALAAYLFIPMKRGNTDEEIKP